jgi:hypothetical protein
MSDITCYLQVRGRNSIQETYETASRHAAKRARQLRKVGYRCVASALGLQVTAVGLIKLTVLTICIDRPEQHDDLPPVRVERI